MLNILKCLMLLLLIPNLTYAGKIKQLTLKEHLGKTSILFTMEGAYTYKSFILSNPYRLVVDFYQVDKKAPPGIATLSSSLIHKVRSGYPNPEVLRLVFDLQGSVQLTKPAGMGKNLELLIASRQPVQKIASPKASIIPPVSFKKNPSPTLRDVIVVIDAGHGGKDPGAKGPGRSQEKDIVLAIALKLKQLIDRQPGMRAVMTRKGDYYIGLRERLNIARKYNGDIFVSIHADAFIHQNSRGASVFALSQGGATSEAARWLAEKENYSELGGVNLADLDDGVVRSVLIDLSQTATIGSSLQLGSRVLKQLGNMTSLHNHRVEQARFMVLKSPDTPSILVETGFISNPREEANLRSQSYQLRLSQSIFQGIKNYFWEYPPHGTRLEAMSASSRHIVQAGETLPAIAARYKTSVHALEHLNPGFTKRSLKPGQKLIVPSPWA